MQAAQPTSQIGKALTLLVWTDHERYSLQSSVTVNAVLRNNGSNVVYLDRRMFWTGYGGGLELEISDGYGRRLPARLLSDAIMPPPQKQLDLSDLIRLDAGFLYGTSVILRTSDFFPKPGRYTIRVTYKSWLRKEQVEPQLRDLPVVWAETPEIRSEPLRITVDRK
jgi:hypothetical protein